MAQPPLESFRDLGILLSTCKDAQVNRDNGRTTGSLIQASSFFSAL